MNPPSVDVRNYLIAQGLVEGVTGYPCFVAMLPDKPVACVVVTDTPGAEPEASFVYERPRVQVRVRGDMDDYIATHTKAYELFDALHAGTISSEYPVCLAAQSPTSSGYDPEEREVIFFFTLQLHRTRQP